MDPSALERRRGRQLAARLERIERLVEEARQRGQPADRAYWALVYDLEIAPMTTNREQLSELDVSMPPADSLSDEALHAVLWTVIHALADLHTYLMNTDHLSDRALYEKLAGSILDEPVREICEGSGGREFIDLAGGTASPESRPSVVDRDRRLPRPTDSS